MVSFHITATISNHHPKHPQSKRCLCDYNESGYGVIQTKSTLH